MSIQDPGTPYPDPMMDELQQIRDEMSAHLLTLEPEERPLWFRQEADKAAGSAGFVLLPHPTIPNCRQMVRKETGG